MWHRGGVSVWLDGFDRTTEVFFGQATEVEGDWDSINRNPKYTREEYIRLVLEDILTKEEQGQLRTQGDRVGNWHRYHEKRYKWYPIFENVELEDNIVRTIRYFNGEEDSFFYATESTTNPQGRAVPSVLYFVWNRPTKKMNKIFKYYFDEEEIYEAFEKLGSKGQIIVLEVKREEIDSTHHFTTRLTNGTDSIPLTKIKSKVFGARK